MLRAADRQRSGVSRSRRGSAIDWRGWIALAWAMLWGWAYALAVLQARAPQIFQWFCFWPDNR